MTSLQSKIVKSLDICIKASEEIIIHWEILKKIQKENKNNEEFYILEEDSEIKEKQEKLITLLEILNAN